MPAERVKTFADILGQDTTRDFLRNAAREDRLAHALLFAGAEGIGKCSLALAFAAWSLCGNAGDDACGECSACRQVAAGSHTDLVVVSVASGKKEIGVDRARELKRFTQLQPASGKVKIAIVDGAQLLTVAAQNALLKTLEDPPKRSILILVANNPDALLPTVRSRLQRVPFSPLSKDDVVTVLTREHGVPQSSARDLASLSEGSPGRALMLRACLEGDGAELADEFAGVRTAGYLELVQLVTRLTQREAEVGPKLEMVLARLRDQAASSDNRRSALRRADLVREALAALRRTNPNRQLLLEALLLQMARI
jgi:DNA polymerase-3 subunit delta'